MLVSFGLEAVQVEADLLFCEVCGEQGFLEARGEQFRDPPFADFRVAGVDQVLVQVSVDRGEDAVAVRLREVLDVLEVARMGDPEQEVLQVAHAFRGVEQVLQRLLDQAAHYELVQEHGLALQGEEVCEREEELLVEVLVGLHDGFDYLCEFFLEVRGLGHEAIQFSRDHELDLGYRRVEVCNFLQIVVDFLNQPGFQKAH